MGWIRKNFDGFGDVSSSDESRFIGEGTHAAARRVVTSNCRTEEVEPGKFVRKCEKTEEIFKDCIGGASEVIQSKKEYTEEDVTTHRTTMNHRIDSPPSHFPGLKADIEGHLFEGINRFMEAAEEMADSFFNSFVEKSSPGIYVESRRRQPRQNEAPLPPAKKSGDDDGLIDLSGLSREV